MFGTGATTPIDADDGEGRGDDPVRRAGRHVAAARRHLIDRSGHLDLVLAQPQNLARRETVAGHRAARAFEAQHDLVDLRPRDYQHGVDLRAQLLHRPGAQIALEGEHKDALARLLIAPRLCDRLGLFLARLHERLALLLVEERAVHRVAHVVVALVQRADLDLRSFGFARACEARDEDGEAADAATMMSAFRAKAAMSSQNAIADPSNERSD